MSQSHGLSRSVRSAAYLAIFYGLAGTVAGAVCAGTFLPYRSLDALSASLAQLLTVISAVGAIVSALGVVGGWGLLRARSWGWAGTLAAALAGVATVAGMAVVWPASAPFLGVVAFFYAVEVILLLIGLGSIRANATRPAIG